MKKELYLFIIWTNARFMEKSIVNDIKKKFELFQAYEVEWDSQNFAQNLSRFYGKKLPKSCRKEKETGTGKFLALLVYDKSPQFANGKNIAVVTAKHHYRQQIGSNVIHASDNIEETNQELLLLFGKNLKEIEQEEAFFIPKLVQHNLVGCPTWNSVEDALNLVKKLPYTKVTPYKESFLVHTGHADIARRILNAQSHFKLPGRHKYFIRIGKLKQPIYIRKVS